MIKFMHQAFCKCGWNGEWLQNAQAACLNAHDHLEVNTTGHVVVIKIMVIE